MRSLRRHLVWRQYSLNQRQRWHGERTEVMLSAILSNCFSLFSVNLLLVRGAFGDSFYGNIGREALNHSCTLSTSRPCCAKDISTVWCYKETDFFVGHRQTANLNYHFPLDKAVEFIPWINQFRSFKPNMKLRPSSRNFVIYYHVYILWSRITYNMMDSVFC